MTLERILSSALTVAAIGIAGSLIHREVRATRSGNAISSAAIASGPVRKEEWRDALAASTLIGDSSAAIQIIEFSDFECPYCKRFHESYEAIRPKFAGQIALRFVHFPLGMHKFARPAARAADCAVASGRFADITSLIFRKQDSLGLKSWLSFAEEAGVSDTAAFLKCASDSQPLPRVEGGLAIGEAFGVRSTPTIIINGWQYDVPPTEARLESDIRALLAGKQPSGAR